MKNLLILFVVLQFVSSCNEPTLQKEKLSEHVDKINGWEDYPNENTKTKIIKTKTTINDKELIGQLEKAFKMDKFKIEGEKDKGENSYANCKDNLKLVIKGNGIKYYYVKRTEAKPKNYYPDFSMSIYEFKTIGETVGVEKEIKQALCNRKSIEYIVRYKKQIIHLETRAEMFRGYIKNYADKINKFSN